MSTDLSSMIQHLTTFAGISLTGTLANIERDICGVTSDSASAFLNQVGAKPTVLAAAGEMKRLAGQINVTIHALGILLCLPHILEPEERVESVSLGAGNTGRQFDLETNFRVAEFKFINWRGGAESIRQNSVFKDYFLLADTPTTKRKYLYLFGTQHPLKFLNGGRAISSVLSKDNKIRNLFYERFSDRYLRVRDYFQAHQNEVTIIDVSDWLHELREIVPLQIADDIEVDSL